jgi:small conductance mechanosensitive channel
VFEIKKELDIPTEPFFNQLKSIFNKMIEDPVSFFLIPLAKIIFILILTVLAAKYVVRLLDWLFQYSKIKGSQANTFHRLLKSISQYMIYFVGIVTILINIGFDPMPIFASAGILGLAIGMGAQNMVKDVISGFFLVFEGQIEVGDVVQINNDIKGTVEEVGLRIVKIREYNQRLHYLPNGEIIQVTNYNREKMRAIVTVTVPFEININKIERILSQVCDDIYVKYADWLLDRPEITGVTNIDQSGVHVTVTALCIPEEYITLERLLRVEMIQALKKNEVGVSPGQIIIQQPSMYQNRKYEDMERKKTTVLS